MAYQLLPEWVSQEALILAYPHSNTDWDTWLEDARAVYHAIIEHITTASGVVLLLTDKNDIAALVERYSHQAGVIIIPAEFNDTWVRDYGFLTLEHNGTLQAIEFEFNGWGNKFNAQLDTQVNRRYLSPLLANPLISYSEIVEGGALEIDSNGHLLSTAKCLYHKARNPDFDQNDYQAFFNRTLGARHTTILEHGHLENDDTDGHIDTLARFTLDNGIVYQGAENRRADSHFTGLSDMVEELQAAFPNATLHPLPLPMIMYKEDNGVSTRLPASYANYLIFNDMILAPIYAAPEDQAAIEVLKHAYPHHQIIPVNCTTLVKQYGSLHCITMQVPQGTLKPEYIEKALIGSYVLDPGQ